MANTRSCLLRLLSGAEQAFIEIVAIETQSPKGSEYERQALEHLVRFRADVERIEMLLDNPNER